MPSQPQAEEESAAAGGNGRRCPSINLGADDALCATISAGFGFSVGDIIAALGLVSSIIDALRDSGEAGTEYRELLRQLHSLETALIQVKRLDVDHSLHAELIGLKLAIAQCQRTIDEFWTKIQAYQPHLGNKGFSGSRLKDKWLRIKWAVCRKEDVSQFKADLIVHTESIHLLLSTIQMASIGLHNQRQDLQQRSLADRIQDSYMKYIQSYRP